MYLTIDQLQARDLFDVVVTAADVTRGKPDPEVFLTCARRLHASPAACAVIEDAVVGVEAANRAGMFSIAYVAPGRDVNLFRHAGRVVCVPGRSLTGRYPPRHRAATRRRVNSPFVCRLRSGNGLIDRRPTAGGGPSVYLAETKISGTAAKMLGGDRMKRCRILVGTLAWLTAGVALCWWIRGFVLAPNTDGHRVATDLWQYASAPRRMVRIQLEDAMPIEVGDPIYRVSGPQTVEQVGEIRRILVQDDAAAGTSVGVMAEALLYPTAPRICIESHLTYYTTPRSLSWVMETMLPPEKRVEIAQEIVITYESYHAEILQAIRPVIVGGLFDAMEVVRRGPGRGVVAPPCIARATGPVVTRIAWWIRKLCR